MNISGTSSDQGRPLRRAVAGAAIAATALVTALATTPAAASIAGAGQTTSRSATSTTAAASGVAPAMTASSQPRPDATWQVGGKGAVVRSVAFTSSTMYVAGRFTSVRPSGLAPGNTSKNVTRNNVAAFSRSTGQLLAWNPNANGEVWSVAVASGRVYLGGSFTKIGGQTATRFAAVSPSSGKLDGSVRVNASATVYEVKQGPNGNLFLGGTFSKINGQGRSKVAEITPGGALVSSWHPTVKQYYGDTKQCPPRCHPVVFTIDFGAGTVYLGGHFGLVNGVLRNEAAAVALSGGSNCTTASCVKAWNPSIFAPRNCPTCKQVETSRVYTIHVTSNRAYLCGGFWRVNYVPGQKSTTTRYNVAVTNLTNGQVVSRSAFHAEDDGDTPGCALSNGVLYIGGHFNYVGDKCPCSSSNSATRHHAAAVDAGNGNLLSWAPVANSAHGPYDVNASGGTVAFGGYFTKFGGVYQQGVAAYSHGLP